MLDDAFKAGRESDSIVSVDHQVQGDALVPSYLKGPPQHISGSRKAAPREICSFAKAAGFPPKILDIQTKKYRPTGYASKV